MDLTTLGSDQHRWYGHQPLPAPLDAELAALLDALSGSADGARVEAAARVDPDGARTLITFAERAASLGVRGDGGAIARGLLAIALAWNAADDPTDALPALGILHAAAGRTGLDVPAAFARAAAQAPPSVAPVFADFLTRPDLAEIAAVMGYYEGADAGGFRYHRVW